MSKNNLVGFSKKNSKNKKKKNADLCKVGVNKMSVRPTHGDMATGHANSGVGLLIPLRVDTIVTKILVTNSDR